MKFQVRFHSFLLIYFFIPFNAVTVFSQEIATNSFYLKSLKNSMDFYHQSFANQSALFNGPVYHDYLLILNKGQPYFYAEDMTIGSLVYDDVLYDSVMMQYDEIADMLIVSSDKGKVQIWDQKVSSFHLYNTTFIRLQKDNTFDNLKGSHYYNLLYSGKIMVLKKEVKIIQEKIYSTAESARFTEEKNYYYIVKDGVWHSIVNSRDFYKILGENKAAVKQFVKLNHLSFRTGREEMLTKAATYFDSLK